jgi:hypothetical protein
MIFILASWPKGEHGILPIIQLIDRNKAIPMNTNGMRLQMNIKITFEGILLLIWQLMPLFGWSNY